MGSQLPLRVAQRVTEEDQDEDRVRVAGLTYLSLSRRCHGSGHLESSKSSPMELGRPFLAPGYPNKQLMSLSRDPGCWPGSKSSSPALGGIKMIPGSQLLTTSYSPPPQLGRHRPYYLSPPRSPETAVNGLHTIRLFINHSHHPLQRSTRSPLGPPHA